MSCKQKTLKNVKKGFVCVKNIENRALSRQEFVKKLREIIKNSQRLQWQCEVSNNKRRARR